MTDNNEQSPDRAVRDNAATVHGQFKRASYDSIISSPSKKVKPASNESFVYTNYANLYFIKTLVENVELIYCEKTDSPGDDGFIQPLVTRVQEGSKGVRNLGLVLVATRCNAKDDESQKKSRGGPLVNATNEYYRRAIVRFRKEGESDFDRMQMMRRICNVGTPCVLYVFMFRNSHVFFIWKTSF